MVSFPNWLNICSSSEHRFIFIKYCLVSDSYRLLHAGVTGTNQGSCGMSGSLKRKVEKGHRGSEKRNEKRLSSWTEDNRKLDWAQSCMEPDLKRERFSKMTLSILL